MERVPELLKSKIMSADQAAQFIQTGMTIGVSGFTSVGYPKAVPEALVRSGHARDLTICVGAAVGDEIDGAMVRAGLVKKRYAHQSHKDLRNAINAGTVGYSDVHISHFPMHMNQHTGPKIDVAVVECTAVSEQGLYLAASGGSADAAVRNADKVIVEVNETLPEGLVGMHDIFEIGLPPHARIIPITKPDDRVGTPYIRARRRISRRSFSRTAVTSRRSSSPIPRRPGPSARTSSNSSSRRSPPAVCRRIRARSSRVSAPSATRCSAASPRAASMA